MHVVLLATGELTKLRPLTETIPSPMLPILNRPVMEYGVELLARQGFKEILVSLFHLGGSIEAHFARGRRWGVRLEYHLQRDAWGSAGALNWAAGSLGDAFIVMPADALFDIDLAHLVERHRYLGGAATVVVHRLGTAQTKTVGIDGSGRVTRLGLTQDSWHPLYNTDLYVFERAVLDHIEPHTQMGIHDDLLPRLMAAGLPVFGYQMHGYWNPLDSFGAYDAAQRDALSGAWNRNGAHGRPAPRHLAVSGTQVGPGIWVGRNNAIHPSARLSPPVFIGENCQIGRNVELGPNAVIGANVIIADEATVNDSTVLDNTYVGRFVNLENRVVNKSMVYDPRTEENSAVVDAFLLSEATPERVGSSVRRGIDSGVALLLLFLLAPLLLVLGFLSLATTGRFFESVTTVTRTPTRLISQRSSEKTHRFERWQFAAPWLGRLGLRGLPALWHVLRGDMSLVGVRPLTPADDAQFHEEWQRKRYEYPAGLTGLWFVQTDPAAPLLEIVINDVYYVATRSWRGDLVLLLRTPRAWLRRRRR